VLARRANGEWPLALLTAASRFGPKGLRPVRCTQVGACDEGCIAGQVKRPSLIAFHGASDGFPRGAMTLETSVLEFNASAFRCLFVKPHLDLASHVQVSLECPLRADIPTEDNANRRLVDEDARSPTFGTIDGSVEDVTSHPRLEYGLRDRGTEQLVLGRLEVSESLCEYRERPVNCRVDDDVPAYRRLGLSHDFPFSAVLSRQVHLCHRTGFRCNG
jgi:hypothetical protein